MGGLLPESALQSPSEQARQIFEQMDLLLQSCGMEFSDVVRTWFYNESILDWYGDFNKVRDVFFHEKHVYAGQVPASTGVGGSNPGGTALTGALLAVKAKNKDVRIFTVPSPLQSSALDYGSSFSRAIEVDMPGQRRLYVSGTASIDAAGAVVHLGDPEAQVGRTMKVVHAILESRDMDWDHVTRAVAYFKHAADAHIFEEYRTQNKIPRFPAVVARNDICRDELLFEIEVDAIEIEQ
jgi:enamine deaminase RidA (YjgF/YER057c/UK114 family)